VIFDVDNESKPAGSTNSFAFDFSIESQELHTYKHAHADCGPMWQQGPEGGKAVNSAVCVERDDVLYAFLS